LQARDLLEGRPEGLLPFLPLAEGGTNPAMVDAMFEKLRQTGDVALLETTVELAVMTFEHYNGDLNWLSRRIKEMPEIRETTVYEDAMRSLEKIGREVGLQEGREVGLQEGREKGLQEGREKGLQEGRLETLRDMLIKIVEVRMPVLIELALQQAPLIDDLGTLQLLIDKMLTVATVEEARHRLLDREELLCQEEE
jgi:hypothetical protein